MNDTKKTFDKVKEALKQPKHPRQDSGFGADSFADRVGKGNDNGDAPTLESKPSRPVRRVKPKSSKGES